MTSLFDTYQEHKASFQARLIERARAEVPSYKPLSADEITQRVATALEQYARDLDQAIPHLFQQFWRTISYDRAQQGVPLRDILQVLLIGTQIMIDGFRNLYANDLERQLEIINRAHTVTHTGVAAVYEGYEQYRMDVIDAQRSELQELSTPIIPIYTGILVLPLVGSIDSRRAALIMEGLLEGISSYSADVVIMDITGVPVIDTGVANYLLQSARAARLLGSQIVLVGIGAEIAQTVVQLGIDMGGIATRANLQGGIEYALSLYDLAIRPA